MFPWSPLAFGNQLSKLKEARNFEIHVGMSSLKIWKKLKQPVKHANLSYLLGQIDQLNPLYIWHENKNKKRNTKQNKELKDLSYIEHGNFSTGWNPFSSVKSEPKFLKLDFSRANCLKLGQWRCLTLDLLFRASKGWSKGWE